MTVFQRPGWWHAEAKHPRRALPFMSAGRTRAEAVLSLRQKLQAENAYQGSLA